MSKIKILYVVSDLRRCGPTNQLYGIVSNLDKKIFDFKIITLNKEPDNSEVNLFLNKEINVISSTDDKKNIMSQIKKIRNEIRKYNPDIIHSSGIRANILASIYKKDTQQIITLRNNAYKEYPMQLNKFKSFIAIKLTEIMINKSNYCVCCSECLKNIYSEHGFENIITIQNGVDINKYNISKYYNNEFENKKKLDLNKKIFIVTGLLNARKNVLIIIKAFLKSNRRDDSYLILLGDGNLKKEAINLSNQCSNIIFTGNVNNVPEYLSIADYYISASKSEGLPNSVLEAGCMGLNLILSDISEHREIEKGISHSTIEFFKCDDLNKLISIISSCNSKLQGKEKENNSTDFVEHFSSNGMSKKYAILYERILSK